MIFIDSHCHLYYEPYVNNLHETIKDCKENHINLLLSISVDQETSLKNINISESYGEVYCTIGLHPNYVKKNNSQLNNILSLYKKNSKILGIGETGIDLYRSRENLNDQENCFIKQIEFGIKNNLPVVVHSREAEEETLNILKQFGSKELKFIMHCFSGSENFANKCLDLGGYISFSGILTFKNNHLDDICKKIPLDRLLIETDSPYLSPHPLRGLKNHPKNVIYVAKKISEIKKISMDLIANATTKNFKKLFFNDKACNYTSI